MASIGTIAITPTPVAITEARKVRTDDQAIPVEQAVDVSPESRKLPDTVPAPSQDKVAAKSDAPLEKALSDVRPVIERLDGTKDIAENLDETLEAEEPDDDDRALQARGAYETLRQPDTDKTSVATV